jgi:hypothetical protein
MEFSAKLLEPVFVTEPDGKGCNRIDSSFKTIGEILLTVSY